MKIKVETLTPIALNECCGIIAKYEKEGWVYSGHDKNNTSGEYHSDEIGANTLGNIVTEVSLVKGMKRISIEYT